MTVSYIPVGTIACLGWGSLVWDSQDLPVNRSWCEDGPMLPLEFARESADGRLTLVIVDQAPPVQTLWSPIDAINMGEAVSLLRAREKAGWLGSIGRWPETTRAHRYSERIGAWAAAKGLNGVIWTDLKAGLRSTRGVVPSLGDLLACIDGMDQPVARAAEEYVRRAPAQIATPYRAALRQRLDAAALSRTNIGSGTT